MNHPANSGNDGVLLHLGKPYAVGLLWFTVQEDNSKSLLTTRLKKTRADYHCLRTHVSQQQGFGWLNKGHRRGMPVAAAIVADQLVGEWHGMFEADNGWWYLQVRSDTITPQGDRFYTSEEEAFRVFQMEMTNHTWPHAYAPAKWNLTNTNVRLVDLKNLLDGLASTTLVADNLTAVFGGAGKRNSIIGGLAATFLIMGGLAAYSLYKPQEEIVLPPPKMPVIAPKPIPTIEPPRIDSGETISAPQFADACTRALAQLYLPLAGWSANEFTCKNGTASLTWRQGSGNLTDARATGTKAWPQTVSINFNSGNLIALLALEAIPKQIHDQIMEQEATLLFLEENIQPLGNVQVKPITPPAVRVAPASTPSAVTPPAPNAATMVTPLPRMEVTMNSDFGPQTLMDIYPLHRLEITEMTWNIPAATWLYRFFILYKTPAPTTTNAVPASGAAK